MQYRFFQRLDTVSTANPVKGQIGVIAAGQVFGDVDDFSVECELGIRLGSTGNLSGGFLFLRILSCYDGQVNTERCPFA